jgi:hypothetical protein
LILGLLQLLLTILLLSLYLLSALLVQYCSLDNQYTHYLKNLSCYEIPNIFMQWTRPLQELTNQCSEDLSEFINAWEKVEWGAFAV